MSDEAKIDKQGGGDGALGVLGGGGGGFFRVGERKPLSAPNPPAVFACDAEHRVSESCDAVPWSVIEEVLR